MSKSLGNAYILQDLITKGFDAVHYRYFCLLANYRSHLNFTWDGLQAAKSAYTNLVSLLAKHKTAKNPLYTSVYRKRFSEEILDDLNTPKALAIVWELLKLPPSASVYSLILEFDKVLSLGLENAVLALDSIEIPQEIISLADKRLSAKKSKDFKLSDSLREQISSLGYEIQDTKDSYTIVKK